MVMNDVRETILKASVPTKTKIIKSASDMKPLGFGGMSG